MRLTRQLELDFVTRHHCLGNARRLIGEPDGRDLHRLALKELRYPWLASCIFACHTHHCGGADDQHVSLLTDAAKPFFTAGAVGTWRETQPGRELATRPE